MLECPFCSFTESRVCQASGGAKLYPAAHRRRRECLRCQKRFTTWERLEVPPILVIKRDGRREAFERGKLLDVLLRVCEKRQVSGADLEKLVTQLETYARFRPGREVLSARLWQLIAEALRPMDRVAWLRFVAEEDSGGGEAVELREELRRQILRRH
jgi:transcriptional repressor NrdR